MSFKKFHESNVAAEYTPAYVAFLEEMRSIEEWLNELGVEVKSSSSYYRANDQPYCYIKFPDGGYILVHLMYGKMDYEYYAPKANLPTVKCVALNDFLNRIRPYMK